MMLTPQSFASLDSMTCVRLWLTGHLAKFGNMVGPWHVIVTPHLQGANSSGLNSDDLVAGFGQWF